jgi:hypothetical protein
VLVWGSGGRKRSGVSDKVLYDGAREPGGGVILNTALYAFVFCPQLRRGSCTPWPTSPSGLPNAFREHKVPKLIESV